MSTLQQYTVEKSKNTYKVAICCNGKEMTPAQVVKELNQLHTQYRECLNDLY